ncbi:hypothetical protein VPH35_098208 [Triticum aestivum]
MQFDLGHHHLVVPALATRRPQSTRRCAAVRSRPLIYKFVVKKLWFTLLCWRDLQVARSILIFQVLLGTKLQFSHSDSFLGVLICSAVRVRYKKCGPYYSTCV